jgi:hypothetical protein
LKPLRVTACHESLGLDQFLILLHERLESLEAGELFGI